MSVRTRSQLKGYNNTYIIHNEEGAIDGAMHNTMNDDLIDSLVCKSDDNSLLGLFTYDSTRAYIVGQGVLYSGNLYRCITNTTGTWDSSKWAIVETSVLKDEFSFTDATIGSELTLISGYIYQRAHGLGTMTPKFRLTRPNGKVFSEFDLDFTIIDEDTIQIDFGFEIDTGTSYCLIEK